MVPRIGIITQIPIHPMAEAVFRFVSRMWRTTLETRIKRSIVRNRSASVRWRSGGMVDKRPPKTGEAVTLMHNSGAEQVNASLTRPAMATARGRDAYRQGIAAEDSACSQLVKAGWTILLRRARTRRGEIDIVACKAMVICFVEVKKRRSLRDAAFSLSATQSRRLFFTAECILQQNPHWQYQDLRFDLMMQDDDGHTEWLEDIIRQF
ncbi:MAG: YraN family protein [Acetobacter sp.]